MLYRLPPARPTIGAVVSNSLEVENTSTTGRAKHRNPDSDRLKPTQNGQFPGKTVARENCKRGRGADGQPALLAAAIWYAERGYPVFPLHSVDGQGRCSCGGRPGCKPGKHPRTKRGHLAATTDPDQLRRWWERWPDANIGIPTGERSGRLVLDVDTYNYGAGSLEALEAEHGELPDTLTCKTGRGGLQHSFRYPTGCGIRNSTGERNALGRGLDIRGEGGYVVVPPSRTEGPYEWLDRLPLAEPPEWLLEALRKPTSASGDGLAGEKPTVSADLDGAPIPEGTRNEALASLAGRLHDGSRSLEQLAADLQRINNARCVARDGRTPDPLPGDEVWQIARSIHALAPCKPAPEPDPETLAVVRALYASILRRLEWKGIGGGTDRAVYVALLLTAHRYGQRVKTGVKVYVAVRTLAELAGTSKQTVIKALKRLASRELVYRASKGTGVNAGALVLRAPQALTTQPRRGEDKDSGQGLRDVMRELLRLRWGAGRIGKQRAALLELLALAGGELSLSELAERSSRRRDNVKRSLKLLEARCLVDCFGATVRLVADFRSALGNELLATGILATEEYQKARHEDDRRKYVSRWEEWDKERRLRRRAAGSVSELERLEPVEKPVEKPVEDATGTIPSWTPGTLMDGAKPPEPNGIPHARPDTPCKPEQDGTGSIEDLKPILSSVSEVFSVARDRFNLPEPAPPEPPPFLDKSSPAAFLLSELRGVSGVRFAEMWRRWKALGGERETLEAAIEAGPYSVVKEHMDFNQPYVYHAARAASTRRKRVAA